ncbi:endonuclease/exonuclease/phosphatase family protein [Niallia circulans]|uniref:endonuclease/exonuclease/phosphatase family protein n=1 Tax=Niallia circulans TaxID=1397 RepID=UPI00203BD9DA|nr:endonuclease/exonuclease/phosphatase family protein [Niallia circulans]MCM2982295.1 endonuclease/exonuclease/phosphatase family protein [Niallia circulans]
MNCLFWNVGRKDVNNLLLKAVIEFELQLIALAEYVGDKNDLLRQLTKSGYEFYHVPKIGCERIDLFTVYKPGMVEHLNETSYYTIKRIPHKNLGYLNFAFVHFPSKLHMNEFDFLQESKFFREDVEDVEKSTNSNLTVLIGDFNMNPFEEGMTSAAAIHSFPTKYEAKKERRKFKGRVYNMFFNPMWSFLGDENFPMGTYYYPASHYNSLYWNIFDQLLVRPSLADNVSYENIKIVTDISGIDLSDKVGKPKVSDHFPLYFKII